MSLIKKSNGSVDINDKVIHYLRNSTRYPPNNSLLMIEKSSLSKGLFPLQHRIRCCSEDDSLLSSSSSVIDSLSRSDSSIGSSLSDPIVYSNSNILSEEELDFNIGFDQVNNEDFNDEDNQCILNRNNGGKLNKHEISLLPFVFKDAMTLLGESTLDARINELEGFLRQSSTSTIFNDDYEFNNDDTITADHVKKPQRASFLYDSTHTLCSHDRFSAYVEDEDEDKRITGFGIRSNSLSILQIDNKSTFVEKAPKKVVRFADMMVCYWDFLLVNSIRISEKIGVLPNLCSAEGSFLAPYEVAEL
jgi:hypothetical protein